MTLLSAVTCATVLGAATAFTAPSSYRRVMSMSVEAPREVSRQTFLARAASASMAALAAASLAPPAFADPDAEEVPLSRTKLGGLLEPYVDNVKGFRVSKPTGWNQFDAIPGEYDVKFVDIISPAEVVLVTTTPIKSDTKLDTLGGAEAVAEKLSKGRGMTVESARERITDGIHFLDFEFKSDTVHEVRTLAVYKNKLWSLSASTPERGWGRREQTYKTLQLSFLPRL